ncbi:hypothetical protein N7539_006929 [Penicillium diatomitis]|uniref:CCHC-type domain-containing protein n=1 Tax=Penicillium diatomitis TaxID=2819901 RepID=A0A9W9X262_9EURO|nr:uncharacterized protein N7539_006929 [Penicillium diatomitis]KAJ5481035.1 hypothetical protein N7539_006929 [Penicillium diatomitis]
MVLHYCRRSDPPPRARRSKRHLISYLTSPRPPLRIAPASDLTPHHESFCVNLRTILWSVKPATRINWPSLAPREGIRDKRGVAHDQHLRSRGERKKKKPKMMLSRRACYKCGNIGHYAEVCSSSERLCYNCTSYNCSHPGSFSPLGCTSAEDAMLTSQSPRQATWYVLACNQMRRIKDPSHEVRILGHESSACPQPRTTETKQCYNCQGLGHVQADCPTLRLNGGANGRCYNCNQPGHLARNCTNPAAPGAGRPTGPRGGFQGYRGGFSGYPRAATCYKCGGPNHFARDCQAQAMKCYACGKLGHISRDCTAPNGGPLSSAGKVCYKCAQAGHISRDCPTNTEASTSAPATGAAPAVEPAAVAAATAPSAPAIPAPTAAVEANAEASPVAAAAAATVPAPTVA